MIGTGAGEGNCAFASLSPRESVRQLYYRLTEIRWSLTRS